MFAKNTRYEGMQGDKYAKYLYKLDITFILIGKGIITLLLPYVLAVSTVFIIIKKIQLTIELLPPVIEG